MTIEHSGIDLTKLDNRQLQLLAKEMADYAKKCEDEKREKAISAVTEAAAKYGFKLKELLGTDTKATVKVPVKPKYSNPTDSSQQWSGRGRRPAWVVDALANGKELDDLLIS